MAGGQPQEVAHTREQRAPRRRRLLPPAPPPMLRRCALGVMRLGRCAFWEMRLGSVCILGRCAPMPIRTARRTVPLRTARSRPPSSSTQPTVPMTTHPTGEETICSHTIHCCCCCGHTIHRQSRDLAGAPRSVRVCSLMPFVHVAWLPKVPHKPAIVAPRILLTTLRIPYADLPDCCSAERGGRSDHQGHDKCQEC